MKTIKSQGASGASEALFSRKALSMSFSVYVIYVMFCGVAAVEGNGCVNEGACICVFENGSKIDLSLLGNKDGAPLIKDMKAGDYSYSFNPCYPFNEENCTNVAGCQNDAMRDIHFPIGDANSAELTYSTSSGILTGTYTTTDQYGKSRTSIVSFTCDPDADKPKSTVFGEEPPLTYTFAIASRYACITEPTPIPTSTVIPKKSCRTNYGNFIKICNIEYDGHKEPVKVLFIRNWNGICKFPTDNDVAISIYSEKATCAGVTNRCNPVQAFSVNGEVCKKIN